ncbi:MAG: SGNH/GDSL hydrolase family protein [Phycisphaerae bacterium]|nr:SGNH/GDSL hydrolase family protein [Phycisphaerae bacterium]
MSRRKRWIRAILLFLGVILFTLFVGGELYMRLRLHMADPPVYITDPLMQYRFAPSQTCQRLASSIHINAYSMRSDDFPQHKSDPAELRVILIGDSVINGGSRVDQEALVSSVLQNQLADVLQRKVVVGNASTGGWGPPQELGWLQTFGTLDADIIVLVISSHDYADVPHWPLDLDKSGFPTHKPLLAWQEFLTQYVSRLWYKQPVEGYSPPTNPSQTDINWCSWAIQQMIRIAHQGHARVIVAQYPERAELGGNWMPGHAKNLASAKAAGADAIVQFAPTFEIARAEGPEPYRPFDSIHPNGAGHKLMADDLQKAIIQLIQPAQK